MEEIALCVRLHLTGLSSYSVSSRILIGRFTVYARFICSKKQNEPEIVPIVQNVVVQIKSWKMPPHSAAFSFPQDMSSASELY